MCDLAAAQNDIKLQKSYMILKLNILGVQINSERLL